MQETKSDKFEFYFEADELRSLNDQEREHRFGMSISDAILLWRKNNEVKGNTYMSFTSDLVPDFVDGTEFYVLVVNIVYQPRFVSVKEELNAARSKVSDV